MKIDSIKIAKVPWHDAGCIFLISIIKHVVNTSHLTLQIVQSLNRAFEGCGEEAARTGEIRLQMWPPPLPGVGGAGSELGVGGLADRPSPQELGRT